MRLSFGHVLLQHLVACSPGVLCRLRSVVWSALRMGSNTDAFLSGVEYGSFGGAAEQPLVDRSGGDEESLTSAGLDGDAGHTKTSATPTFQDGQCCALS